jgi:hypothetical protein
MSRTYTDRTAYPADLRDADGNELGRQLTVFIDFMVDVDTSYGADADGNRGTTQVDAYILDLAIDPEDLKAEGLDSGHVERALADARAWFERTDLYHLHRRYS